MTLTFTSELPVELIQVAGSDAIIAAAARTSTGLDLAGTDDTKDAGLIGYLMRSRHGSPFEHGILTFRIEAPIFVFRELMRHRIASYNEASARYMQMQPKFYVYPDDRPLVQAGSGAHPRLEAGNAGLTEAVNDSIEHAADTAWFLYETMIEEGAALEVARAVLPVTTYSTTWASMNPRALMNFLSLRVNEPTATFPSNPQWEIAQVAEKMEALFAEQFPATHQAFVRNGRVAP